MNFISKVGQLLLTLWLSLVKCVLPTRFKRFIILTTIFQKGFDENIFDTLDFKNLNNRLDIAHSLDAMRNISMVASDLWSDIELKALMQDAIHCNLDGECISLKDASGIGEKIFFQTPVWLRYDKQTLIQDITSLFVGEKVSFSPAK